MNGTTGRPASRMSRLATSLSIAKAEPVTAEPTNGTSAGSRAPCTVPSSPFGPCRTGNTTSKRIAALPLGAPASHNMKSPLPPGISPICSAVLGIVSAAAPVPAPLPASQTSQRPSLDMPINETSYRLRVENHYSAAPTDIAIHGLSEFDEPLPQYGVGVQATIEMLDATVATAGPRYYGFVIGGTFPVSVASNWLSTACDQCSGSIAMSPLATKVESTAADLRSARDPEFFGGRIRDRIYRCACRLIARRQTKSIRKRPRFHGNIYGHRA